MTRSWTFESETGEPIVVREWHAQPQEEDEMPLSFAIAELDAWLANPEMHERLGEIVASRLGRLAVVGFARHQQGDALRFHLVPWLKTRELVLVGPAREMRPVVVPGQVTPPKPGQKPPPVIETDTWFQVRVVDEVGDPIANLTLAVKVDGATKKPKTDAAGKVRIEHAKAGLAWVDLSFIEARTILKERWAWPREAKLPKGPNTFVQHVDDDFEVVTLESETPATIVLIPQFECREIPGARFEFGRSFVRREAFGQLGGIAQELAQPDGQKAMIFGHTDEAGPEDVNKELAERRARAVYCLLRHDTDGWEALWTGSEDQKWKEKWSSWEAAHMMNALKVDPDGQGPLVESSTPSERTVAAIEAFQAGKYPTHPPELPELETNGELNGPTRKELFLAYARLVTQKPVAADRISKAGQSSWMGCGEFNPLSAHGSDAESRRVVVLIFDPAAEPQNLPCKLRNLAPCHASMVPKQALAKDKPPYRCKVYQGVAAMCPCSPGPDLSHDFVLVFPLTIAQAAEFPDRFILESEDGTIRVERALASDAQAHADGIVILVYPLLPEIHSYRMTSVGGAGGAYELFGLTPYEDLDKLYEPPPPADEVSIVDLVKKGDGGTYA